MLELNPFRKNKVNLQDYDYQKDIQNRLIMSKITSQDLEVLEELFYGHPKLSIPQLAQDLLLEESELLKVLSKFAGTGLFQIKEHSILMNKEVRKYFESQLQKFEEDFEPGMEYLQSILRKVPFHTLLTWYPIPRTSNNIFESLVEKYLLTPQIFQRYLLELNFGHPKVSSIVEDVYNARDFMVSGATIKAKYELSDEEFEEIMLHLEFNFVCCLIYKKTGDHREQVVTPFQEWRDYLRFLRDTKPTPIENPAVIVRYRKNDFAFVEDMTLVLGLLKDSPIPLTLNQEQWIPDKVALKKISQLIRGCEGEEHFLTTYLGKLIKKLIFLRLCKVDASTLKLHEESNEWLALSLENRALAIYKHTLLRLDEGSSSLGELPVERAVREIEKCLIHVLHLGWVEFGDFIKGVAAPLSKESKITLKKLGKTWKYSLPVYTQDEVVFIKKVVFDWLFEAGLVAVGAYEDKEYFRITAFGQSIFS